MRTHLTKRTIAGGVAVLALLGAGGGIAAAAAGDSDAPAGQSTQQNARPDGQHAGHGKHGKHHGKRSLVQRAQHGQFTVGGKKGERVLLVQRGTVESFDGKTLKLKSQDGFEASYTVGEQTRARKAGKRVELSEIKQGERVGVFAEKTGDTATAKTIRETQPKQK